MSDKKQFNCKLETSVIELLEQKYLEAKEKDTNLQKGNWLGERISAFLNNEQPKDSNNSDPGLLKKIEDLQTTIKDLESRIQTANEVIADYQELKESIENDNRLFLSLDEKQAFELWGLVELSKNAGYAKDLESFIFQLLSDYRKQFNCFILTPNDVEYLKSLNKNE